MNFASKAAEGHDRSLRGGRSDIGAGRVTWNRVMTRYSRDTDVILGGIGYRF
ncbi:hypothetical protein [Paraburkholderia atlantica]|uniref:hypothetical protein n=1 Tax=Paraburkholderia atlantica TaxID=2654982 RepID=UPI0012FE846B|nr:hypothetical protein [Paraburkholderia atlantica]